MFQRQIFIYIAIRLYREITQAALYFIIQRRYYRRVLKWN